MSDTPITTIPQLNEITDPPETSVMAIDNGIVSFKLTLSNLVKFVKSMIGLASDTNAGLASPDGNLKNAHIASDADISWSKINSTGAITNADVAGNAAIAGSKIDPSFTSHLSVERSGSNAQITMTRLGTGGGVGHIGANVNYTFMNFSADGTVLNFGVHQNGHAYAPFGINFGNQTLTQYREDYLVTGGPSGTTVGVAELYFVRINNTVHLTFRFMWRNGSTAQTPVLVSVIPPAFRPSVRQWGIFIGQNGTAAATGNNPLCLGINTNGSLAFYGSASLATVPANNFHSTFRNNSSADPEWVTVSWTVDT